MTPIVRASMYFQALMFGMNLVCVFVSEEIGHLTGNHTL